MTLTLEAAFGKTWRDKIVPNGVDLDGTGDYCSGPDHADHDIVGDIEMRARMTPTDNTPGVEMTICSKWESTSDERSYDWHINTDGTLEWEHTTDGAVGTLYTKTASAAPGYVNGVTWWAAVTVDASTGTVTHYWHADPHSPPTALSDWDNSDAVAGSATSIYASTAELQVGMRDGTEYPFTGIIHDVFVYDGMVADAGTLTAAPRFSDIAQYAIGQTSATTSDDENGYTWTLVADAAIVGSWTDLTDQMVTADANQGRLFQTGVFEAGTARALLRNNDRRFEPGYAAGPYYPDVVPNVPIRFRAGYGQVSSPRWTGYVEDWVLYYLGSHLGRVSIVASDGLALFANHPIVDYETEVAADAPIAWWKLEDQPPSTTAVDDGSLGVDGTYRNTPTLNQVGPIAGMKAVVFEDSLDQDVLVGILTGGPGLQNLDFSVEFWLKVDGSDAGATSQALVMVDVDNTDGIYPLGVVSDRTVSPHEFAVVFPNSSTSTWAQVNADDLESIDDEWVHVAVTVKNPERTGLVYVNGEVGAELDLSDWDLTESSGPMFVAIAGMWQYGEFDGGMAQVAIYDRILSPGRVAAHARAAVASFPAETYDARIQHLVDDIGWGGGTDLRPGVFTLTATPKVNTKLLGVIRQAARSEGGEVFIGPDGRIVGWSQDTVTDDFGESQYTLDEVLYDGGVRPSIERFRIYNQVRVTTSGGDTNHASDADSVALYGYRELPFGTVDLSLEDAATLADSLLAGLSTPALRIGTVVFRPDNSPAALWPQFRDRQLGERVTVSYDVPGSGASPSAEQRIEHIHFFFRTGEPLVVSLECSRA